MLKGRKLEWTTPLLTSGMIICSVLYGTCTELVPASRLNCSRYMCMGVPTPADPNMYLPGLALSKDMNSVMFLAVTEGVTARTVAIQSTCETAVKSVLPVKFCAFKRLGAITFGMALIIKVYPFGEERAKALLATT